VVPRTERHGAFMAEGYGRAAGFPAVLLSTLGPGVANELVGLHSARQSGAPVLCVTPSQPANKISRIRDVFQGLDHGRFLEGACKGCHHVEDGDRLRATLEAAVAECMSSPSGPVRVDVAFPLLFHRRLGLLRRGRAAVRPVVGTDVVVVRDPSVPVGVVHDLAGLGSARVLAPGIDSPGIGLPFALGAKLACPDAPVVVVIASDLILEQLDTFAVARLHGVPVRVVGEGHGRLADLFGVQVAAELEPLSGSSLTVVTTKSADPLPARGS